MEVALENGGDDLEPTDEGKFQVTCQPELFEQLSDAFDQAELKPDIKEITRLPQTTVGVEAGVARRVVKLLQSLDDHDDVQNVSTNLEITDEALTEE
jgi:transcriptional/translational regulatory protein YebC/TACO1